MEENYKELLDFLDARMNIKVFENEYPFRTVSFSIKTFSIETQNAEKHEIEYRGESIDLAFFGISEMLCF